jgi:4-amino-4-deoxy-L-arabinose transferase-like glycosyltransferase
MAKKFWLFGLSAILLALYLVLRLTNILSLPLFTDEAIYVRWSQIGYQDASWRFISLTDGKQPLFTWLVMVALRFIHDPILAGRLVSVLAGIFSSLGLFFLTKEIFRKTSTAMLASFLYILYPFALVLDRMALYDGLVATFVPWSIWLSIKMVKQLKSYQPFVLSMVIGAGILNKSNAFFPLSSSFKFELSDNLV